MTSITYTDPYGLCTITITPLAITPSSTNHTADADTLYTALMPLITDMIAYW